MTANGRPPWVGLERFRNVPASEGATAVSVVDGVPVASVNSLPHLTQLLGYLKYVSSGATFLRGQAGLHKGSMQPSLLRGGKHKDARGNAIQEFVQGSSPWQCSCKKAGHRVVDCTDVLAQMPRGTESLLSGGVPRYAAEPLLQHYGIRTRWLDVVDNIWVALWFACHHFVGSGGYMHPVRRSLSDGKDDFVYLVSVSLPGPPQRLAAGYTRYGNSGRVVDLREAVPSFYVRPHAQHGLLVRPHEDDYRNLELAAVRVPLANALDWLGSSVLLGPFGLFPPASVDQGYKRLLQSPRKHTSDPSLLGQIDVIGPGY